MAGVQKFITLDVWGASQQWIHDYIDSKDAKSLTSVALNPEGTKLLFYRVESPTPETLPDYEVEIPAADLSTVIRKVLNATDGNVPVLTTDGSLKDSGITATSVATHSWVTEELDRRIIDMGNIKKEIVQVLPEASQADENTFYLIKIESATGKDLYEIWTKIGSELVLIDDTSIDLKGYVTSEQLTRDLETTKNSAVKEATEAAAIDAQTKADQALSDAKAHVEQTLKPITENISKVESDVATAKGDINGLTARVDAHNDRLTAVENKTVNFDIATVDETLEVFNSIYNPPKQG